MSNRIADDQNERASRLIRLKSIFYIVWATIGIILLVVAAVYALGKVGTALVIIGLAAFIVFILRFPVSWLERRKVPRPLGTLIAYVGGFLLITLVLLLFIPIIWQQTIGLIRMIPEYMTQATSAFNSLYTQYGYLLENSTIHELVNSVTSSLSAWAASLVSQAGRGAIDLGTGVVTSIIVFTVSLIVGFWILMDLPKIGRELRIVIGPKREDTVMFVTTTLSNAFGGYLRGMTVCAMCTGTIAGIGFYIIGLPYPAVLGMLTGLLNFIPYVGPWLAGFIAAMIGLFVTPVTALLSILITVIAQQIVDNFIYPRVMSSAVKLHPAIVLVGVFTGGAIGGIIGLIAAVPLLASAKIIFVHFFEAKTGRELMSDNGALFKSSPNARYATKDKAFSDAFRKKVKPKQSNDEQEVTRESKNKREE